MTRRLLLIRHCESTGQDADLPLTERGLAQADSLAAQLAGLQPDLVVSSPFRRARQTVEPLAAASGLPLEVDARFAERRLAAGPLADFREAVRRVMDDFDLRLPGGESSREAQARGRQAIDELLRRGARLPVVATHGQLLTLLLNACDAAVGYGVWQSMSNPDVFLLECADGAAGWRRDAGWRCTRLPPADAVATNAIGPSPDVRQQYSDTANLQARIDLHRRFSGNPYPWFHWVHDRLPQRSPLRVLDLGCGPGRMWTENAARRRPDWTVTLCDRFAAMVAAARAALAETGVQCLVGDAATLPFAAGSFDCVLANHMLYHLDDRQAALREIARVLAADGCLLATTVGERHLRELDALLSAGGVEEAQLGRNMAAPFTLENGAPQLARVFDEVTLERYADDLRITEVEPAIAYLQSVVPSRRFDAAALAHIRGTIGAAIAARGAFAVGKDSGLFVARGNAAMAHGIGAALVSRR